VSTLIHIVVIEPSAIVFEGLLGIFQKWGLNCKMERIDSLDDLPTYAVRHPFKVVCINPAIIQHNSKLFQSLKCQFDDVQWVGVVYAYFDPYVLSLFDAVISVSDTPESIVAMVQKLISKEGKETEYIQDVLSEREIDVLALLAQGLSNKEVADKLNISINTAITHRKNISQKTGIKSVSGLTIYAVVKKIITLEDISEKEGFS